MRKVLLGLVFLGLACGIGCGGSGDGVTRTCADPLTPGSPCEGPLVCNNDCAVAVGSFLYSCQAGRIMVGNNDCDRPGPLDAGADARWATDCSGTLVADAPCSGECNDACPWDGEPVYRCSFNRLTQIESSCVADAGTD